MSEPTTQFIPLRRMSTIHCHGQNQQNPSYDYQSLSTFFSTPTPAAQRRNIDEFIQALRPSPIGQYLTQHGRPVTQGLTNIINERRRQTPNGPLFVCIGEHHNESDRMADSIGEFLQAYSRNLTADQRRNLVIAIELPPNPENLAALNLSLEEQEGLLQRLEEDSAALRIIIAARRAGIQIALVDSHIRIPSRTATREQIDARETIIFNNVSRLAQGLTNPTIFYYGGSVHCSKTAFRHIEPLATRLSSAHGNNRVISIRAVTRLSGFDWPSQDTPNLDQIVLPASNPVIAPIGGPVRNGIIGTYDYIITSPSIRR